MSIASASALGAGLLSGGNVLNAQNSDSNSTMSSSTDAGSSSVSRTFGSEASAADILRAKEANELNDAYMLAQMQFNASEAEKARIWSENMSNTAYQRVVKDLKAAGLNPILAIGNGAASTPMTAQATGGLQSAHKANTYVDSMSSSGSYETTRTNSNSNSKSRTQLATLMDGIGQAAKGVMEGAGAYFASAYKTAGENGSKVNKYT